MKFQIKSRYTSNTIFEDEATSFSALVQAAVKAKVSLRGANLSYANLIGANLNGANLSNANLRDADLSNADLIDAGLRYANLIDADLSNANLSNANLSNANLRDADLSNANLHSANLSNADLLGADLSNADLIDANLSKVKIEYYPIQVLGHKHFLQTTNDGRLSIGCNTYTFTEWKRHAAKIGKLEGYSSSDTEIYKLHISHIEKISKIVWKVE